MGKWTGVVTNAGNKLFEDWVNGTVLHLDNAAAGTGTVPDVGMLAQTKLVSQKQVVNILSGETIPEGRKLKVQITAPQAGYTLNQIGLWGHIDDSAPVMFALFQNSEGVAIPSFADSPDFAYTFYSTLAVSNQGELEIHINPDVLATIGYVDDAIQEQIILHIGKPNGIAELDSSGKVPVNQLPDIDVSGAIGNHDADTEAHPDLRELMERKADLDEGGKIPANQLPAIDLSGTINAHNIDMEAHPDIRRQVSANAKAAATAQKTADSALREIVKINNTIHVVPTQSGTLTYNSSAQSPTWNSYNPDIMTLGGVTSGTDVGTYTATFTPKDGYFWEDGGTDAKSVTWVIVKATVSLPTQNGTLTYNGSAQSPTWNNYDAAKLTIGGTTSATNAGTYNATFTPTSNYQWSDGSITAKTVSWSIAKATVSLPTQSGSLTYNGNSQSPIWSGYDSGKLTLGGTTSGTNAGNYTATFTPKTNYQWSDGSVTAKNATWKINKAAGSLSLNKTSLSLNASTKTGTITVTRAGDGAITATSSSTNVATVSVSGTTVTVTAVGSGSSTITVKVAEGTNHTAPANKTISVTAALANVFGVCWDMSNSSTALTRLTPSNDPNGLVTVNITTNPSPAVGTGAGSSPFDNYSPWKDMDEYNIINNAVSHKRGTSSFSRTTYNTMVYIPTFYYRIFDSNGKRYFYISDTEISGFTKHPGSNKYVGRYNTIAGTNTSLSRVAVPGGDIPASASGHPPRVSLTRAAFREAARSKGDKWSLYDYVTWCAVWLLYLVEFADWNSQAKIGQGIVSASAAQNTGGTDTMSYHTGRAAGTDGQTAVQYRHIENPWGNVYEWIDGINFDDRTVRVCTDPAKYADDTTTDYMVASTITGSNGFIKSLGSSTNAPYAFLPNAVGGSNSTYIPDYYYQNTGWRVLQVGGSWNNGLSAGLFCFSAYNSSSSSISGIGARLLYHP